MLDFTQVEKKEFTLIDNGEYEVTLSAEWEESKDGTPYIGYVFQVRKDVEQNFGGRLVFDGVWKNKDNDKYQDYKIEAILKAIPDAKLKFESYDEVIQYINGTQLVVKIDTKEATEQYAAKNVIDYRNIKPTNNPTNSQLTPVEDDELPF